MVNRCDRCNSPLRMVLPQVGDRDSVWCCTGCGRVEIWDAQPSAPANLPARPVKAYKAKTPLWLN